MDASQPSEQLFRTWAQSQQQLLTNWLDTVRSLGGSPGSQVWGKTMETWQTAVQQTLDAQAQWTREWSETLLTTPGIPEDLRERVRQGQQELQRWTDAQRQLWQSWFDMIKGVGLGEASTTGAQTGQNLAQIWTETAQKMIDAQSQWIRLWTTGITGTKTGS
jgi:hypothetical protein